MTYNTPELLLVGAAQNLVLGTQDKDGDAGRTNIDSVEPECTYSFEAINLDGSTW